jgi:hypothetical protein
LDLFQIFVSSFYHRPIIIVGFGQVGKTTLHKTLIKHPQIATLSGAKESPYFSKSASLIYDVEFSERSAYLTRKLAVPKDRFFNSIRRLCFETSIGPHYGVGGPIKALVLKGEIAFGKRHWCVQTFPDEMAYQCILGLYPQAKFIYLTRNAINAIHDQMNKKIRKGVKPDFKVHATKWEQSIDRCRYLTEADSALHIPFEALSTNPQQTITTILEFIGVSNQPILYKHTQKMLSRSAPQKPIAGAAGRTPNDATRLNAYQAIFNSWPEEFRIEFRRTCSGGMAELGYQMPE